MSPYILVQFGLAVSILYFMGLEVINALPSYQHIDDSTTLMKCPANTQLNGNMCVPQSMISKSAFARQSGGGACTRNFEIQADPINCSNYLVCQAGIWVTYTCARGAYFDAPYGMCRHGACSTTTPVRQALCQRSGTTADLGDCSRFYFCAAVNSQVQHLSCPANNIFDMASFACILGSCETVLPLLNN